MVPKRAIDFDFIYLFFFQVNGILHVAGQIGLIPGSMKMIEGGLKTQALLSLRHVERILAAKQCGLGDIVQVIRTLF